jgi:hypothetical protein
LDYENGNESVGKIYGDDRPPHAPAPVQIASIHAIELPWHVLLSLLKSLWARQQNIRKREKKVKAVLGTAQSCPGPVVPARRLTRVAMLKIEEQACSE